MVLKYLVNLKLRFHECIHTDLNYKITLELFKPRAKLKVYSMLCEPSYRKAMDSLARGTRAEMALGSSSNPIWFTICLVGIRIRQARRGMRRRAVCAVLLFICSAHLADRFDCGEAVREQREWNEREGYWHGDLRQRWYLNDAHVYYWLQKAVMWQIGYGVRLWTCL